MSKYTNSRNDAMTFTANWILKHAGSRAKALQLRSEFMSNKQWIREDVVNEYKLQKRQLTEEKISKLDSFETIEKKLNEKYEKRNSKSDDIKYFGRMILYGDGSKWLTTEQINSTFSD